MSQWHVKGCPGNPLTPPTHTHTPKPFCMYAHTHTHWSDNEKKWLLSSFHLILFVSFQGRSCIFSLPSWSLSFVTSKTFLCQPPALLSASPFSAPWDTHTHISITFSGLEQRLAIQPLKPTRGLEMELLCEYTSLLVVVYTRTHKGVSPIDWLTKLLPCRRPGKQQAKQFTFYERLHRNWYSAYLLQKWLICLLIVQMIQALSCLHYDCLLLTVRFMSFQTFRSTNTHNNRQTDVTVTCLGRSREAQNGKIKA